MLALPMIFSNAKMLFGLTTMVALALVGCGKTDSAAPTPATPSATSDAKAPSGKTFHLAFVTNNASDFWTIAHKGTDKADAELTDAEVEFKMPQGGTAAEQKQIIDDLLAKGVDGIAISLVDPANETEMVNEAAKKTLVFTQDSDAPKSNRSCYVGTDNVAAGHMAGDAIKKSLPAGGKIMVFVGKSDAQNAKERFQGIKEALAGSNVTILGVLTDDTDRVRAKANVADTLVKTPDIAALVGLWSYNGPAIYSAVKDANKVGKVKIICFDEEDDTLAGIRAGAIDATVVQQPFEFGYQAVKNMEKVLTGDKSVIPADKKVIVPTQIIDKATVEEFTKKLKELRGK